eukprot:COSAG01_NODE_50983_length_358_cov_1.992278_1_plen_50_part_10
MNLAPATALPCQHSGGGGGGGVAGAGVEVKAPAEREYDFFINHCQASGQN